MTESVSSAAVSRRTVLAGAVALGATGVLAACGSGGTTSTGAQQTGPVTVSTADVPVGGGTVVGSFVVTQPVAGSFKAFSSTCTHQGCTVAGVESGVIVCPCHGSTFSATDGSVRNGPATFPLPAKSVSVSGNTLTVS
jgi:Rieske Fe-S protein